MTISSKFHHSYEFPCTNYTKRRVFRLKCQNSALWLLQIFNHLYTFQIYEYIYALLCFNSIDTFELLVFSEQVLRT